MPLEKFFEKKDLPENRANWYNFIDQKRKNFFNQQNIKNKQGLEMIKREHDEAMEIKKIFLGNIKNYYLDSKTEKQLNEYFPYGCYRLNGKSSRFWKTNN